MLASVGGPVEPGEPDERRFLAIASASLVLRPAMLLSVWFDAQVRSKWSVVAKTTAMFVTALVRVGLILAQAPLSAFVAAIVFECHRRARAVHTGMIMHDASTVSIGREFEAAPTFFISVIHRS